MNRNELSIEDKLLLIKDLSARLPYAVTVEHTSGFRGTLHNITVHHMYDDNDNVYDAICYTDFFGDNDDIYIEFFKPYLFPLSSMTKEQKEEMKSFDPFQTEETKTLGQWVVHLVDFYNKYHFDYRGLIEKGLALDATGLNIY